MRKHFAHIESRTDRFLGIGFAPIDSEGINSVELTDAQATAFAQLVSTRKFIKWNNGQPAIQLRSVTKQELVSKLIKLGKAIEFDAILGTLPLEEKLMWDASSTIAPDYPFIVEKRAEILAALQITGEQFDSIFH
jgi:hypothetical protein